MYEIVVALVLFIQAVGEVDPCSVWTQCTGLCLLLGMLSEEGTHLIKVKP